MDVWILGERVSLTEWQVLKEGPYSRVYTEREVRLPEEVQGYLREVFGNGLRRWPSKEFWEAWERGVLI